MSEFLTIPQAADRLGISRASMWRIAHTNLIATVRLPIGGVRIAAADLDAFVQRCRHSAISSLPTRPSRATRAQLREAADRFATVTKRQALRAVGRTR